MKVYLDESYPAQKDVLILGALITSNHARSGLFHIMHDIKTKYGISGELKYSEIFGDNKLNAVKEIVDNVMQSRSAKFIAYVIPYSSSSLNEPPGIKLSNARIGLYVHYAYELVYKNIPENSIVDVFCDKEERIAKTKLYKKLKKAKFDNGTQIRGVTPVDSKADQHCVVQIADLLSGAVLQGLYPSTSENGKYKKEFSEYVATQAKILDWHTSTITMNGKFRLKFCKSPNFKAMKWKRSHHKSRS